MITAVISMIVMVFAIIISIMLATIIPMIPAMTTVIPMILATIIGACFIMLMIVAYKIMTIPVRQDAYYNQKDEEDDRSNR